MMASVYHPIVYQQNSVTSAFIAEHGKSGKTDKFYCISHIWRQSVGISSRMARH